MPLPSTSLPSANGRSSFTGRLSALGLDSRGFTASSSSAYDVDTGMRRVLDNRVKGRAHPRSARQPAAARLNRLCRCRHRHLDRTSGELGLPVYVEPEIRESECHGLSAHAKVLRKIPHRAVVGEFDSRFDPRPHFIRWHQ